MGTFDLPVSRFCTAVVHTLPEDTPLPEVEEFLFEHHVSAVVLTDEDGSPSGVITRTDLLAVGRANAGRRPDAELLVLPEHPASQLMTRGLKSIPADMSLPDAAAILVQSGVHRLFVNDADDELAGVLSAFDLVRAVAATDHKLSVTLQDVAATPVFTVRAEEPLATATDRLSQAGITGLVVLDEDWPVGIFSQEEALSAQGRDASSPVEASMSAALLCLDGSTPLHRVAAHMVAMEVRHVLATHERRLVGIATGMAFARFLAKS